MTPPDPQDPPGRGVPVARVGIALALALGVALALNPDLPLNWAYDTELPETVSLALIDWAEAYRGWAQNVGLDALNAWAEATIEELRYP
ncbi:MAG: hypothetical protein AAGD12_08350 [Pseudomonadota bacterium]